MRRYIREKFDAYYASVHAGKLEVSDLCATKEPQKALVKFDKKAGAYSVRINGGAVLVDQQDIPVVLGHSWRVKSDERNSYAVAHQRGTNGGKLRLHRLIIGAATGELVDHINGNGLDNRRANLRLATNAENVRNSRRWIKARQFFKGITQDPSGKFRAQICINRQKLYLGKYSTAEEAAQAYDAAALAHFGAFARVNFPKQAA